MDPLRIICQEQGFFTRGMARDTGYDDKAITAMVRGKAWKRFRRGYYTFCDIWAALDAVGRHRVRSRAVMHSLGDAVALSHVSGCVGHGMLTWAADLDHIHVTRLDGGAGRVEGDVVHHTGVVPPQDVCLVDGLRVLRPERCALELASWSSSEAALVVLDSLLHLDLCDPDALQRRFADMNHWPRFRHLHIPVRMADGRSESVGESRGRWLFWCFRLPAPVPQFEVWDEDGDLRGTCDWGWPELKSLGEFDGKAKYGRLLRPGQDVGEVVFAEKRREDELRELTGFSMIRLTWSDYDRPRVTAARLDRMLRRTSA